MTQNTIRVILGMLMLLGLISSMTSCTNTRDENTKRDQSSKDKSIRLRATNLLTNTTESLIVLDSADNVYKIGDTTWAFNGYIKSIPAGAVIHITSINTVRVGNWMKYRIEED